MDARGPFASASRSVRLAAALALTVALGTLGPGQAQIVRDGKVGPAGPLTGPNYTIPHTDGTRAGANLFHSFSRFNLHTGESATFTGPGDLANVISRVTGGERSTIDGLLRSQVGQANVWFLNPAGVLLQTLSVVGGSPGHGRPDPQHWRASQSGGDGRSWYGADTGRRPLGAGPGAVRLAPDAQEQGSRVDTSGNGGGQITIRGGQIEVTGSSVLADNTGAQDAWGGIAVSGDTVRVADGSKIRSSTRARGSAGRGWQLPGASSMCATAG